MNAMAVALSIQPVQKTMTCGTMGFVLNKVDRDLITMMARMTIDSSVMYRISTAQQVDILPNQRIVGKVHPRLARDVDGLFRKHG